MIDDFEVNLQSDTDATYYSGWPDGFSEKSQSGGDILPAVPSGSFGAKIVSLSGNSIAWKNIIQTDFSYSNYNGVTVTPSSSGDGVYTFSGTSTDTVYARFSDETTITGHVYYTWNNSSKNDGDFFLYNDYNGVTSFPNPSVNVATGESKMFIRINKGINCDGITARLICIDMTTAFNVTTAEAVTDEMIATVKAMYSAYTTYNTWSVRNAEVTKIRSTGKNLFDIENLHGSDFSYSGGTLKNTVVDTLNHLNLMVELYTTGDHYISRPLSVSITSSGTYSYTFTLDSPYCVFIKHNGSSRDLYFTSRTALELPQGTYTLSLTVTSANPSSIGGLKVKNMQIEKGTSATDYEQYEAQEIEIPLDLRSQCSGYGWGINNSAHPGYSTRNYINFTTGEYVQMTGYVDLGDCTWVKSGDNTFYTVDISSKMMKSMSYLAPWGVCAKYPIVNFPGTDKSIYSEDSSAIYVKDSSISSVDDLKTALSGFYLFYPLAKYNYTDVSEYMTDEMRNHFSVSDSSSIYFIDEYNVPAQYGIEFVGRYS